MIETMCLDDAHPFLVAVSDLARPQRSMMQLGSLGGAASGPSQAFGSGCPGEEDMLRYKLRYKGKTLT